MEIELQIFANFRDILGFKKRKLIIPANLTVKQFLDEIRIGFKGGKDFFSNVVDKSEKNLLPYVKIILDGKILMPSDSLNTIICKDVSVIAIFPAVGGG